MLGATWLGLLFSSRVEAKAESVYVRVAQMWISALSRGADSVALMVWSEAIICDEGSTEASSEDFLKKVGHAGWFIHHPEWSILLLRALLPSCLSVFSTSSWFDRKLCRPNLHCPKNWALNLSQQSGWFCPYSFTRGRFKDNYRWLPCFVFWLIQLLGEKNPTNCSLEQTMGGASLHVSEWEPGRKTYLQL